MDLYANERGLTIHRNDFLISDSLTPTQRNQAFDEIMAIEKDLASLIYIQKDREGRIL